jgi:tRNA(fMet)-specific endonuclease VapC
MAFLLDTKIVSDVVRNPQGRVAARLANIGDAIVATSIIVAAELHFGALRKKSPRLTAQLEVVLGGLDILPFAAPADRIYGELRAQLESKGTPVGANDLLIAAHALALGYTLVSHNVREFSRIKGLKAENWLR